MLESLLFVYARYNGMKRFKAFDVNECVTVDKLICATLIENSDENRVKLQALADLNKKINLRLQLREHNGKIVFETK